MELACTEMFQQQKELSNISIHWFILLGQTPNGLIKSMTASPADIDQGKKCTNNYLNTLSTFVPR